VFDSVLFGVVRVFGGVRSLAPDSEPGQLCFSRSRLVRYGVVLGLLQSLLQTWCSLLPLQSSMQVAPLSELVFELAVAVGVRCLLRGRLRVCCCGGSISGVGCGHLGRFLLRGWLRLGVPSGRRGAVAPSG
jgi:hypothetical protein